LSRLDRKITAAGDAPLELAELLAALESHADTGAPGWRDASPVLGGAFAKARSEKGLSGRKES
jgi:hypothetical protein